MSARRNRILSLCLFLLAGTMYAQTPAAPSPQLAMSPTWWLEFESRYLIRPNLAYSTDRANTLDIWTNRSRQGPQPTVIFIHGGGWTGGWKEAGIGFLMPYIAIGWNVVNVDYRVARMTRAPAAVEDCLCALRFIVANAERYQIDVNRLVITGDSAGGHLALTTSMIRENADVDRLCPGAPLPKVAAVVDFYGITDVGDLLDGPNERAYAVTWLGDRADKKEIAERVSPLKYVRAGLPPIMMIHGDADPVVPYQHSVRLKDALDKVGVPNSFHTVPSGLHGRFPAEQYAPVYRAIMAFLKKQGLPVE